MNPAPSAAFWGLVSRGALVLGAAIGYRGEVPARAVAAVMAFGSGVLTTIVDTMIPEAFAETHNWARMAVEGGDLVPDRELKGRPFRYRDG